MLDRSDDIACRVVWKPVLTSRDAILQLIREANVAPNVVGIITWMHTFSPAKMWIAGLCALDKPMLHLHTQANTELPWATIDFDFMNLNQAAHGDREFGYIETRLGIPRTTVVGHASDPTVTSRIGDWCRAARRLARRPEHERRPLRRQHALRRRDRGRQDRGRGDLRFADQHMGGDGPGVARRVRHRRADRRR